MKKLVLIFIITALLPWSSNASACTNFPINIGTLDTESGRIIVESLSVLINERTGVTVGTHYFKNWQDLDKAVTEKRLEMTIEDTSSALVRLNLTAENDTEQNLEQLKQLYKSRKMIWLKPFAFTTLDDRGITTLTAPVITRKALSQFPALPRLIRKLSRKIDDQALQQLVQGVKGSTKPQHVGKDFLREQKLI